MKKQILSLLLSTLLLASCGASNPGQDDDKPGESVDFNPAVTNKNISKEEYLNKTLGGLLGQFAGFLSGYEFASWIPGDMTGLPLSWFDFINGPYAGNFTHFTPSDIYRYNRLNVNPQTGLKEVWSDDDYHIDIFNQYILKEKGYSSYDIKETWKKYKVSDWGGGSDAMMLINAKDMLSPFTGTIEAGNRYGWCTEAYIENETLGMNAPGMPNVATALVDKFATNVGYFDSVNWAKFYATMYSLAYFEDDPVEIMKKASEVLPKNSYPYKTYQLAMSTYEKYPNDYKTCGHVLEDSRRNLYRIDNIQTDPNVNGGLFVLSILFGKNSYLETCKYASMFGFDGDCTAAIACGFMGILKGFKSTNEEYAKINELIYHDGEGMYHNDTSTTYQAKILGTDYPTTQKIDEIVKMYQDNFEKILILNGGTINDTSYTVPTTDVIKSHSYLFTNYDGEERTAEGFTSKNGTFTNEIETDIANGHTGFGYFKFKNTKEGELTHRYQLVKGKTYRLTTFAKTEADTQVALFARDIKGQIIKEEHFANVVDTKSNLGQIGKYLTFTATTNNIDVGFKFGPSSTKDEIVYFDDFMLEEINAPFIQNASEQSLTLASKKFTKVITKPETVKLGEEVILSIQYRQYSNKSLNVSLNRNGELFGGTVFSNTSKNSFEGYGTIQIPYVFEKNTDTLVFNFDGKIYFGNIDLIKVGQYMFR